MIIIMEAEKGSTLNNENVELQKYSKRKLFVNILHSRFSDRRKCFSFLCSTNNGENNEETQNVSIFTVKSSQND